MIARISNHSNWNCRDRAVLLYFAVIICAVVGWTQWRNYSIVRPTRIRLQAVTKLSDMLFTVRENVSIANPSPYVHGFVFGNHSFYLIPRQIDVIHPNCGLWPDSYHRRFCGGRNITEIKFFRGQITGLRVEMISHRSGWRGSRIPYFKGIAMNSPVLLGDNTFLD